MKRILNDLSMSRRVANTQETSQLNQGLGLKEITSQVRNIPKHGQNVQSLIGDYQCPLEVFERDARSSNKTEGSGEQILNQQWDEPPHMQPPMRPTVALRSQQNPSESRVQTPYTTTNMTSRQIEVPVGGQQGNLTNQRSWDPASTAREKSSTSTTRRQIETPPNEQQENQSIREMTDQIFSMQGSVSTPTRHRRLDQTKGNQCTCCCQQLKGNSNQEGQVPTTGMRSPHTGGPVAGEDKSVRDTKEGSRKDQQECKVIRTLPDEELDFMDLVRDSVSAQARTGPKPMFVNNYFVGDNNWRTVAREKPAAMRQTDESKNRSSIAVQTAVSLLGEEDKPARFVQTGISRMKAMGNNEGMYNTQSPLVVEPARSGNSTGWSTNSFNLPEVHQSTSVRQQCKGLPDLTVPPPPIQDHTLPQGQSETNTSGRTENAILRVIERMTDTMEADEVECNQLGVQHAAKYQSDGPIH